MGFAPPAPAAGQAVEDLLGGALRAEERIAILVADDAAVGGVLRDARLAEVLGDHNVGGDLRPASRDLGVFHLEDDGAVRVGDARGTRGPYGRGKRIDARLRVVARNGESLRRLFRFRSGSLARLF